jgi:ABC-type glycerol-3-phosphate transport system permease component
VSQVAATALARAARRRRRRVGYYVSIYGLLLLGTVVFTLPFFWMVSMALKPSDQIFVFPPVWLPDPVRWENFAEGWSRFFPFTRFLINTLIITGNNVVANLFTCTLVAYGFARLRAPESGFLFTLVLATMMVPEQVTMIPVYWLFTQLGWVNTFLPLTVPSWFGYPFFIFLLRQFFLTLPRDLDDAARIDGCSTWGILYRILLPLSKPALAAVAIFAFIRNWNSFLYPLIYLNDMEKYTLQLGLNMYRGQYYAEFHLMMAVALLVLIPVIVIFFLAQQYFIQGIALTGLKG